MKKLLSIIMIFIMMVLLGACNSKNTDVDDKSVIKVYYINSKTSGIVSEDYKLISSDKVEQIGELLYMLRKDSDNLVHKNILPDEITYTYELSEDGNLTLNFDSEYNKLTGVDEVLCRAAIVKTLCQIAGVDFIQINVNGSPLILNNEAVGPLNVEDFIDSTETNTNYKIKLYFANKNGDGLIEYDTDLNYSGTSSLEELAIEKLINGPTQLEMYDTIPKDTILLNTSKNDGICIVDFNEKFLKKLTGVDEEVTIYSIVNTLVELPDIKKVQFTINSQVVENFGEYSKLDDLFERNLNLIEKAE